MTTAAQKSVQAKLKPKRKAATNKGLYRPINPQKYLGDPTKIRFLSAWELRCMDFFDKNPNVIAWGSEEIKIPYWNPIKKTICTYYPDFLVKYKDVAGRVFTEIVEVKPFKEAAIHGRKKISAYDQVQLVLNHAKWQAADVFCKKAGMRFRVMTEAGSGFMSSDGTVAMTEGGAFRR